MDGPENHSHLLLERVLHPSKAPHPARTACVSPQDSGVIVMRKRVCEKGILSLVPVAAGNILHRLQQRGQPFLSCFCPGSYRAAAAFIQHVKRPSISVCSRHSWGSTAEGEAQLLLLSISTSVWTQPK